MPSESELVLLLLRRDPNVLPAFLKLSLNLADPFVLFEIVLAELVEEKSLES